MGLLLAIILSFVPALFYAWLVYWMDRFEKEPKVLLGGVFVWGAVVAVIGAIAASLLLEAGVYLITESEQLADVTGTIFIAPFVEETIKGMAVLIVFLFFRNEFDSALDGIIYASITALGFAATENVLYLYSSGYQEDGMSGLLTLFVLRVVLGGWNHAVYTACIGIGLAVARLSRNCLVRVLAPTGGWIAAMLVHGIHNGMVVILGGSLGLGGLAATLLVDWLGWLGIFCTIIWALARERAWISTHLREELDLQVISPEQYRVACSTWAQSGARLRTMFGPQAHATRRFYQVCAELAQKKHQHTELGEDTHAPLIEQLRAELAQLAPQAGT